jgi:hypothetical protein
MTHRTPPEPTAAAVQPVQAAPGTLIHPAADRRLAVSQWLLATLPDDERQQARAEWQESGVTLLRLGVLFSAVRLPAPLVLAAAGGCRESAETDVFLADMLDDGPVIYSPRRHHYYALVRASMPRTWTAALDDWRGQEVDVLGRDTYLGVPHPGRVRETGPQDAFWAVPMESAGALCAPLSVARLIAAGVHQLAERAATA